MGFEDLKKLIEDALNIRAVNQNTQKTLLPKEVYIYTLGVTNKINLSRLGQMVTCKVTINTTIGKAVCKSVDEYSFNIDETPKAAIQIIADSIIKKVN